MSLTDLQLRLQHGNGEADDWTKIEDKALRKTIQNRLAQRKRRTKILKGSSRKASNLPVRQTEESSPRPDKPPQPSSATEPTSPPSQNPVTPESLPSPSSSSSDEVTQIVISRQDTRLDVFTPQIQEFLAAPGLAEHRFLTLSQYSFLRAFVHNAQVLGLDPALFADDNSLSPWTVFSPYIAPSTSYSSTLAPTPLQLTTFHHPYIDVIASAKLRENILLADMGEEQEDDFCRSLHENGFVVWGSQPWNPMGWELSQGFVNKWGWMVDEETLRCSNFWRFERGELPLHNPHGPGEILGEVA